jgi:hypothetical protein
VPGDPLKHRLAHTFSICRWFQFTSPFCPSIRLLRRRASGRRLDNSQCRTDKGCSSIGFPLSAGPARAPISCSDDPLQSSCAPLSIPVDSRTRLGFSTSCATAKKIGLCHGIASSRESLLGLGKTKPAKTW